MDIYKEMQLDETLVKIAQEAYEKSSREAKREIKGECYTSKDPKRKDKILTAKKVILSVASVAVIAISAKYVSDMDAANDIRNEITKTETHQNLIGGNYETNLAYDDGFVDSMNDLSDSALHNLYDNTSKEMIQEGNKEAAMIVSEVVEQMEENYLEEQGRAR